MFVNKTGPVSDFYKYSIGTIDIVFAVFYSFIVVFGLIGNCLVITVVRKIKSMRTTTNYVLVNLAVSDIITLLWCPRTYSFAFYPIHPTGSTGDILCKIFTGNAVISVAIASSVLTLTLLATERYHALMKPMNTNLRLSREFVKYVVAGIWILAIIISIPDFSQNKFSRRYGRCVCPFSLEIASSLTAHVICTVLLLGFVPFVVLAYCYFQIIRGLFFKKTVCAQGHSTTTDQLTKKRLAKLLISITVAFYICYLPYGSFILYIALEDRSKLITNQQSLSILLRVFELLVASSSCLNPVLYAFRSSNYLEGFRKISCGQKNFVQPLRKLSSVYVGGNDAVSATT